MRLLGFVACAASGFFVGVVAARMIGGHDAGGVVVRSEPRVCSKVGDGAEIVCMEVTAYCPCKRCCGRYADGRTASGALADHKLIAAPSKYPFGTVMEVPGYGRAKVEDRGGAIRAAGERRSGRDGRGTKTLAYDRIDVLFPTHQEALKWGRRVLPVKVWR